MDTGNRRKAEQLGMPISTASHRLKKMILFDFAQRLGRDTCYHCGQRIERIEEFSLEHKQSWLYQDTARFWQLDNITFSHLRCNTTNRTSPQYNRGQSIDERKRAQLGMSPSSAIARLRVLVMFDLLSQLDLGICYRCGEHIASAEQLSVEHKIDWLDRDPQLFWDLGNVAFSHRLCNSRAASRVNQGRSNGGRYRKVGPEGTAWCGNCRLFLPIEDFSRNRSRWNGVGSWCAVCERLRRSGAKRLSTP
ncbi:MAG: hypothetical protein U0232_16535 [Thermomicrobiales bacterium]